MRGLAFLAGLTPLGCRNRRPGTSGQYDHSTGAKKMRRPRWRNGSGTRLDRVRSDPDAQNRRDKAALKLYDII